MTGRRQSQEIQGGDNGGDNQWTALSRGRWQLIQTTAKAAPHGGITGGRSYEGGGDNAAMGMIGGNGDAVDRAHHADEEPK